MLIGDFSPEDCDGYLARRLSRDGRPLIGPPVREVITCRSGHNPSPDDFDQDFSTLIAHALSDLTPDELHVLRSVALLDAFGLWPFHLHGLPTPRMTTPTTAGHHATGLTPPSGPSTRSASSGRQGTRRVGVLGQPAGDVAGHRGASTTYVRPGGA